MLFHSSSPQVVVYIKRNTIMFIFKDGSTNELALLPELVQNLEVLDSARLSAVFNEYISKHDLKNKHVLIVLDESIVFEKDIPLSPNLDIKKLREDFLSKVPFDTQNRSLATLQHEKQLTFFATNQMLYQLLVLAFEKFNNKILTISPATLYGLSKTRRLTKEQLTHLFEKNELAKHVVFLPQT